MSPCRWQLQVKIWTSLGLTGRVRDAKEPSVTKGRKTCELYLALASVTLLLVLHFLFQPQSFSLVFYFICLFLRAMKGLLWKWWNMVMSSAWDAHFCWMAQGASCSRRKGIFQWVPYLSLSFQGLPATLGIPGSVDASLWSLPLSYTALFPLRASMSLKSLSLYGHLPWGLGPTLNPGWSHLEVFNLIISVKTFFPNKAIFPGFKGLGLGHILLGGHHSTHYKEGPSKSVDAAALIALWATAVGHGMLQISVQ